MQKLEEILTKTRTQLWYEISLRILRDRLPRLLIIKLIRSLLTTKLIFWSRIFFIGPTHNRVSKRESITKARDLSLCPSCPPLHLVWVGQYMTGREQNSSIRHPTIEPPTTSASTRIELKYNLEQVCLEQNKSLAIQTHKPVQTQTNLPTTAKPKVT